MNIASERFVWGCGVAWIVFCTYLAHAEEWRYYGCDPGGTRYSTLRQINTANASKLERVWTYRTGDVGLEGVHYAECTPLVIDGVLYMITPFSRLIALDATTGVELWHFNPDPPLPQSETGAGGLASRGVAYWEAGDAKRIFLPVRDGRIYAIDINTRAPDADFGDGGHIDLRAGLPGGGGYFFLSSPPAIHGNLLLQPYGIGDTSSDRLYYVPLRAYDTRTGKLVWTFDPIAQPGDPGQHTWEGDSWKGRSGCNPWAPLSVDVEHGIFYVPLSAPNADKFGGDRLGDNLYSDSIVALDAATGKMLWQFQTVHHDAWDYDLPAMPNVVDLTVDGEKVPAVAVVGKTGFVYLFNRLTGEPIFPIEERPVPASTFPGETVSKTQPVPTKPPAFSRQRLTPDDLNAAFGPAHLEKLKQSLAQYRSEGIFTPPSPEGSVVFPGQLGGGNWSGAAVSPDGMMYVTANELPYVVKIRQAGGEYGVAFDLGHFLDEAGYPVIAPPWGTLTKIDLGKGTLVWQKPLGEHPELTARGIPPTGQMNFGGGTVTAGGVVFIAASMDGKFRVFDCESGDILFETQMEVAGYGAPVTYSGSDGKQYVVIFAGGGGKADSARGDYVIAFALP